LTTCTAKDHASSALILARATLVRSRLLILDAELWPEEIATTLVTDKFGDTSLIDCPVNPLTSYEKDKYLTTITALETEFKCAGMCYVPDLYLFSDAAL